LEDHGYKTLPRKLFRRFPDQNFVEVKCVKNQKEPTGMGEKFLWDFERITLATR
jgi:hypothetical protein